MICLADKSTDLLYLPIRVVAINLLKCRFGTRKKIISIRIFDKRNSLKHEETRTMA